MPVTPGARLFLNYRRDDAEGQAGRLYDRVNAAFPGRVFRDVSGIDIGVDFARAIQDAIASSRVLLAVIGRQWLAVANEHGDRRVLQPNDYVRLEIATALERKLRVIPVLVDGARMPAVEDLPADIQPLVQINAIELTAGDYDHLVERLITALESDLGKRGQQGTSDEIDKEVTGLARRAEAAIALEDWMAAKQGLQAALSLDSSNAEVAARLRFAGEQLKLSGLYEDGQKRYQSRDKAGALERFRQVRAAGGSYKNVDQLIDQIGQELRVPDTQRAKSKLGWLKWVMAVVVLLGIVGYVPNKQPVPDAQRNGSNPPPKQASQAPVEPQPAAPAAEAARVADPDQQQRDVPQSTAPAPVADSPEAVFVPYGRWDMSSELNPAYGMVIDFYGNGTLNGTFFVQTRAGYYQFPASNGVYQYNAARHILLMSGRNNMGIPFQETIQIQGQRAGQFRVFYQGVAFWMRRL